MPRNPLHDIASLRHASLLQQREAALKQRTPYDLESVGMVDGVRIINDSAATNVVKVAESLSAFDQPLVWIAEANSQTGDFSPLTSLVAEKVKVIVVKGNRVDEIHKMLWPGVHMFLSASSWEEALELALMAAVANETILFSPGSRADEPFSNFKERGAYFNRLIDIKRNTKITIP